MTKRNIENATIGQQIQVAQLRATWFLALATATPKTPPVRTAEGTINPEFMALVDRMVVGSLTQPLGLSAGTTGWDDGNPS